MNLQRIRLKMKSFVIIIILLNLIILYFYEKKSNPIYIQMDNSSSLLKKIDFEDNLCTKEEYKSIFCKETSGVFLSTTICLHDIKRDYTSRQIFNHGIKEKSIVKMFLNYLEKHKDSFFIDIGAHIGMYTLLAAKLGRDVVAVEAFYENIIRLQKAVRIEKLGKKITLLHNAISYKENVNIVLKYHKNIGEQSLFSKKFVDNKDENKRFVVKTIIFDDILQVIPKQPNGKEYQKAVLKIDIEGYEPYAFIHAKKLFEKIHFELILMEWYQVNMHRGYYMKEIELMLSFLSQLGYKAFENGKKLEIAQWNSWPRDIYWTKG